MRSWLLAALTLAACSSPPDATPSDAGASSDGAADVLGDVPVAADASTDPLGPKNAVLVVVLGSSTAAGKNLDQPQYGGESDLFNSWVNRYSRWISTARPGSTVQNFAVAGYSTFSVLPTGTAIPKTIKSDPSGAMTGFPDPTRNVTKALSLKPSAIILSFPSTSDFAKGFTVNEIMANIQLIATLAGNAGVKLWVTTSKPITDLAQLQPMLTFNSSIQSTYGKHSIDFWTPLANPNGSATTAYLLTDGEHPNAEGHKILFEQVVKADLLSEL